MRVVTVAQMRELEQKAFASGTSEDELQRRAAAQIARIVRSLSDAPQAVTAYVGPGNNGRDAFLAAELLLEQGWKTQVLLAPRHAVRDDEIERLQHRGGQVFGYPAAPVTVDGGVLLDGLLGIGGRGSPRPPLDELVARINFARRESPHLIVVAIDTPSGLDADTGEASSATVQADYTVVLGGAKAGLLNGTAARFTGRLVFADIGVGDGPEGAPRVLTSESVTGLLPRRDPDSHKGTYGRLLIVAGSERYVGAAMLCGEAAVRGGAGIVTLAAPRWLRNVAAARVPELTYVPLPEGGPAERPEACAELVVAELAKVQALALGPGLSQAGGLARFVELVLRERARLDLPAVVDADGLNLLSQRPHWPEWIGTNIVLTPHPGELRRLAPDQTAERPWELATILSQRWGVTLVAKGAVTAVADGDEGWVNPAHNPVLATGGTGDVLTGLTGALLARGLPVPVAARLGVWVHSQAGLRLSDRFLAGGLAASDLLEVLPSALAETLA